jgi:EmrB/QacA subfamily drug resistance transporter
MSNGAAPTLRSLPRRQVVITFIGVMLAMFLGSLDQTVVGTAMPRIVADLGGFNQYTWVTSAYIITSAVAIPIVGKLTDMYGRKMFYIGGLLIFTLASLGSGFSYSMDQLIIFRGIQGIGAGVMMANAFTVIGDLFPPIDRGKYQGYMAAVFGISSVIGPTLGGFLTDNLTWHWVFFINVPLGLVVIVLFLRYFPNLKPELRRHKVDYLGLSGLVLTFIPMMLALSWAGVEYPWGSGMIIGLFVFSAVMLALLILIEHRAAEPIIPLSLFKNNIVTISLIVTFLTGIGMFGVIIFIPLYFQGVLGATATASGTFLIPMMLGTVVGSFTGGQILSRAGGHYRLQGYVGLAVMTIGIFLLSRLNADSSYGTAVFYMVITGLGLGSTMPLYMISVQNAVPYEVLGVATSASAFFRSIGGAVGLSILGSIMNNRFATVFTRLLPDQLRAVIPADQLSALATNPQALMSPDAQAQLSQLVSGAGSNSQAVLDQLLHTLRAALSSSLSYVFLIGMVIIFAAFVTNAFIKEIPLRDKD